MKVILKKSLIRTIRLGLLAVMLAATVTPATVSMAETNDNTEANTESAQATSSVSTNIRTINYDGYTGTSHTIGQTTYTTVKSDQLTINITDDKSSKVVAVDTYNSDNQLLKHYTSSTDPLNGISLGDLARTGSKVHLQLNSKYWYQVDGKYIRIGCVAKYKVKNTNSHVLAYRKAIQSSNGYRASSGISVAAALVIVGIVGGTTAVVPPAGIIAGIIAAVGVGANSAKDLYKAVAKVNLAKEEYDMAKVAGTKY